MKKQIICVLVVILTVSIKNESTAQKIKLLKKTHLADYSSASSLEFYKDRLYVIGDDASAIWILDNEHRFLDSIQLFPSTTKRIPPDIKVDLESSTIIKDNETDYLVCISSFSTDHRNKIIYVNLTDRKISPKIIETSLRKVDVEELNIEGATSFNDQLILSNRANATHKNNSLIITSLTAKEGIKIENNKVTTLSLRKKKNIIGISGMTYVKEKDLLLFTASTEDTPNAVTDGTIGTSYIGYIKNISKKINNSPVKATKLISISKYLKEKSAQKIESITVEKMNKKNGIVHLATDNDNGESTLFKLRVKL